MSGPEINWLLALIVVRRVKVNALYSRLNNAFFFLSLFGGRQHSTTAVDGEKYYKSSKSNDLLYCMRTFLWELRIISV